MPVPKPKHPICNNCAIGNVCHIGDFSKSGPKSGRPVYNAERVGEYVRCRHYRCGKGQLSAVEIIKELCRLTTEELRQNKKVGFIKTSAGDKWLIRVNTLDKKGYLDFEGNFYTIIKGIPTPTGQKIKEAASLRRLKLMLENLNALH